MRYIALFESISGASVKDCIIDEEQERAIFIVNQGQVGVAIGKGGRNIHTLERMTGKKTRNNRIQRRSRGIHEKCLKACCSKRNSRQRTYRRQKNGCNNC